MIISDARFTISFWAEREFCNKINNLIFFPAYVQNSIYYPLYSRRQLRSGTIFYYNIIIGPRGSCINPTKFICQKQ